MGEREIHRYPTAALAYTIKSLELADSEAGRMLALRVLQRAPLARIVSISDGHQDGNLAQEIDFSPTGEWVAWAGPNKVEAIHRDGERRVVVGGFGVPIRRELLHARFGPAGDVLVANLAGDIRTWSLPDGRPIARAEIGPGRSMLEVGDAAFVTVTADGTQQNVHTWPPSLDKPRLLGSIGLSDLVAATGRHLAYTKDGAVYLRSLSDWAAAPRLVLEKAAAREAALCPDGSRIVTSDENNNIRVWSTLRRTTSPERVMTSPETIVGLDCHSGSRWISAHMF
jgi:WD40 repeat protein